MPPTPKSERTRQRIIDAAILTFAERGVRGTSIASVANAAHVSPASVFGYFGSKEGLFREAIHADVDSLIETIRFNLTGQSPNFDHAWDVIARLAVEHVPHHALVERLLRRPEADIYQDLISSSGVQNVRQLLEMALAQAQHDSLARRDISAATASEGVVAIAIALLLAHQQLGIVSNPTRSEAVIEILSTILAPATPAPEGVRYEGDITMTQQPEGDGTATKGERTRELILDVSVKLFALNGFKGTSVAQIGRQVGITPAAVFAHFASKENLFAAAIEHDAWNFVMGINDFTLAVDPILNWPGIVDLMWENLHLFPLIERVLSGKESDHTASILDCQAIRIGVLNLSDRIAASQKLGIARDDISAEVLGEGLIDLAVVLLLAQSQTNTGPDGSAWHAAKSVMGMALRRPKS